MSAGEIKVTLPNIGSGIRVAFLQRTAGPARQITSADVGRSWQKVADRLAKSVSSLDGLKRGLSRGVGLQRAMSATGAFAKAAGSVLAVRLGWKLAANFVTSALAQTDIPEIARLNRALGTLGTVVTIKAAEILTPVVESATKAVRWISTSLPRFPGALAGYVMAAVRYGVDAIIAAATSAIRTALQSKLEAVKTTAGLETGGTRLDVRGRAPPRDRLTFGDPAGGASGIFSFPGHETFTGPQNVIVDDVAPPPPAPPGTTPGDIDAAMGGVFGAIAAFADEAERRRQESGRRLTEAGGAVGSILSFAPGPPPEIQQEYGRALDAFGTDSVWDQILDDTHAAVDSLEVGMGKMVQLMMSRIIKPTQAFVGKKLPGATKRALTATDSLNDALALDLSLISKLTASNIAAQKAIAAVHMGIVGTLSMIKAWQSMFQAATSLAAGNFFDASTYLVAAGAYFAAASMAGMLAIGSTRLPRDDGDRDTRVVASSSARPADLFVYMPGYTQVDQIAEQIKNAVNSDVAGTQVLEQRDVAIDISTGDLIVGTAIDLERRKGFAAMTTGAAGLLLFGPIGFLIGTGLGEVFGRDVEEFFDDVGEFFGDLF